MQLVPITFAERAQYRARLKKLAARWAPRKRSDHWVAVQNAALAARPLDGPSLRKQEKGERARS